MKTCLENHSICKAICCQRVSFPNPVGVGLRQGMKMRFLAKRNKDIDWYMELHRIKPVDNGFEFTLGKHWRRGKYLIVEKRCTLLGEDLRCKGHPDKKPLICQKLNEHTTTEEKKLYYINKECIFYEGESE